MNSSSLRQIPRSRAGYSTFDIVIWMALVAILIGGMAWAALGQLNRASSTKAGEWQESFNKWYENWTQSGAIHNLTASNQGEMAMYLLEVATSDESTAGTPRRSGGIWVNETIVKDAGGASLAGSWRISIKKPFELVGDAVVLDSRYSVTFDPKNSKNKGEFIVTVIDDGAASGT